VIICDTVVNNTSISNFKGLIPENTKSAYNTPGSTRRHYAAVLPQAFCHSNNNLRFIKCGLSTESEN
jgi:hypothetical protein